MDWRDQLDPVLKEHFNDLLKKVQTQKKAYITAKNISQAQLWSALAVLMKKVSDLELQVKSLEKQKKIRPPVNLKKNMRKF
ncbi:MAG TPA: hypothetical protein HA360_04570 [Nanoarchaeota archaeon]|nr:hypothetical protein [Candidatus Woesearchaeota archaeon]HIH15148.1 hypothetical protein [Nanoarchaeota archaeon]HIH59414.1 hypothetical protein [Nanoarchaeota archaeon]HII14319.1 hypothetical protein [Nanoarchaeota archaeon]HIJ04594.1 hypothetical protein [Nanoarchaeota archaeon]